jgi:hypothetical protein
MPPADLFAEEGKALADRPRGARKVVVNTYKSSNQSRVATITHDRVNRRDEMIVQTEIQSDCRIEINHMERNVQYFSND